MVELYRIPSLTALIAFEAAARHRNFTIAAEELNTSQSAISRHIQTIETRFQTTLFDRASRRHNRLTLTYAGEQYYRDVVACLDRLHRSSETLVLKPAANQLVIACSHEASNLVVLPHFEKLQLGLGEGTQIRLITSEYDAIEQDDPRVDIKLVYEKSARGSSLENVICRELVTPVCAPNFYKAHQSILKQPLGQWMSLPFLDLTKPNAGWATWLEFARAKGEQIFQPTMIPYDNYVYLLEAAAVGKGIALGWKRFVDRHLREKLLVPIISDYIELDHALVANLTEKGKRNELARDCVSLLRELVNPMPS
ncbi:MAG: LysR family transcriptional regulator [Pseudomonadota bacterium]